MRIWLCIGAANGFIAVAVGALAAHSLEGAPWQRAREWVDTGAEYQMTHALALLAVAVLCGRAEGAARNWLSAAAWSFLAGLLLFSGGLYTMALAGLTGLGVVVPVGGLTFLVGWAALFYAGLRHGTSWAKDRKPAGPDGDAKDGNG
jgi:uncharacterized membrane protein YgdD (TMEM256/DUF423 family)